MNGKGGNGFREIINRYTVYSMYRYSSTISVSGAIVFNFSGNNGVKCKINAGEPSANLSHSSKLICGQ